MIKPKEKPCKGTGQAKGYGCGKPTIHRVYGLGKMCCYSDWLLNSENGKIKLEKSIIKAQKPRKELEQAREDKKQRKSLGWLLINTRTVCHEYIKLRDKGKPCVSCGQPWGDKHQAGHWKKAELYSLLKFDERNIHNQCEGCNIHKDGNVQQYGDRIHLRIGAEGKKELERIASLEKQTDHKWCRTELNKIRDYFKLKIKELKQ